MSEGVTMRKACVRAFRSCTVYPLRMQSSYAVSFMICHTVSS